TSRQADHAPAARARGHSRGAVPGTPLRDGDGAVRDSAVTVARTRSRVDVAGGAPRAAARRNVRARARRRPAVVAGVPEAPQPDTLGSSPRGGPRPRGR